MTTLKRTISVKNCRNDSHSVSVDNFETQNWNKLESAVISILDSMKPSQSYEELYRTAENYLSNNSEALIYENLHAILQNDCIRKAEQLQLRDLDEILQEINRTWNEFCKQVVTIKNIFLCFDRSSKSGKYNTIQSISCSLFRFHIVFNPKLKKCLIGGLFKAIEDERNGSPADTSLLRSLVDMLTELQIYDDFFQSEFIRASEAYYALEGKRLIGECDVQTYLEHVSKRICQENQRTASYLNKSTGPALIETICKNLIKDHIAEILDNGFNDLMDSDNVNALSLMYDLLMKVSPAIKRLVECFTSYITKMGSQIVSDPSNEKTMIQNILDFKEKLDNIVSACFKNNDAFQQALRTNFPKFINGRQNKPAQLLAKYIDAKLRSKEIADEALETALEQVMVIFRFIQGKDIFEAFYKRDLAKRLLLGKSTSQDAEDSMVAKLKTECGSGFTSKIEGMFNDIHISQSLNSTFKQYLLHTKNMDANNHSGSDICINVLTSSFWPNYPNFEVNLPAELASYQTAFQKFYSANHNGRKLLWQPSLGHCVVKATFDAGNKELQVSLFQTLVLLLFNNAGGISFKDICETTNLEQGELRRTLMSLACGKTRVLVKCPKGKDIADEDVFHVNTKFTDKLFRVRVNQIQLKETSEEESATERSVLVDRQFQIDAAIVRVMKSKKVVSHNALVSELFNLLDIPVKPSDLKKRIEMLIERDYMEREKDNPSAYVYIA